MKLDNRNKKQAMGNRCGKATRIFNISPKLALKNSLRINDISKSIESWILSDADLIYEKVYNRGDLELGRDAITLLKDTIKLNFPDKYAELISKKQKHRAIKKYHEQNPAP